MLTSLGFSSLVPSSDAICSDENDQKIGPLQEHLLLDHMTLDTLYVLRVKVLREVFIKIFVRFAQESRIEDELPELDITTTTPKPRQHQKNSELVEVW